MNTSTIHDNDTIVAQATAPGRGGIAIIRVSGPQVKEIIKAVIGSELSPRTAKHAAFLNEEREALDEGIALFFPQPNSFTGEDVLELHGHGGPVVIDLILKRILNLGTRLARPGEFSERAFLNGKIDLSQAEAISDLIDATSSRAARLALRSLQGVFSQAINHLKEQIVHLRMYVEASIDFTEEEIDFLHSEKISGLLHQLLENLQLIQLKAKQGSILREGITAVIAGKPNVGKSSLLNALSSKEAAIVTSMPGTTRDVLREYILIDGMPVHIIDTAGLRESDDLVELEGIRRAHQEIEKADLIIYVQDASLETPVHLEKMPFGISAQQLVIVRNKIDLLGLPPSIVYEQGYPIISLSARHGQGIDLLRGQIKSGAGLVEDTENSLFIARRRHLEALRKATAHVEAALKQFNLSTAIELVAEDLRLAQCALGEITGEFTADDLLGRIFASFCIGK